MTTKAPAIVRGQDGLLGTVIDHEGDDGSTYDIFLDDGQRLRVPAEFLRLEADQTYTLNLSTGQLSRFSETAVGESVVIPIVAEEVEVSKRRVESGRVRVHKTVKTTEQVVDEPVFVEEVEVERVAVNQVLDAPIGPHQEGDTLVVPILEEVLVVEKRLILREEVRITRRRVEHRTAQTITLRREEATVDRVTGQGEAIPVEGRRS